MAHSPSHNSKLFDSEDKPSSSTFIGGGGSNSPSSSYQSKLAKTSENLAQPLMASSGSDPFYAFRDALKDAVDKLELQREKWKGLLHNTNTAESSAFQATDQQLKNSVKKVEQDIKNIKKTVKHVEKNRNQYPHIDDAELKSREDFISRTKKSVQEIKNEINSRETQNKLSADQRKVLSKGGSAASGSENVNKYQKANQDFVQENKQQQQVLIKEQDQHLDQLDRSLSTIGQMARSINTELEEQSRMVDEVNEEVEEVQGKMDRALEGIHKLLKTKDNCQLCTIVILVIVVVALFAAVLS